MHDERRMYCLGADPNGPALVLLDVSADTNPLDLADPSRVPIGAGNIAVFIYATTYLANTYELYAASALASNTVVRSVLGGVLPLIGSRLYQSLGANWASSLLGFLQIAIIPIPFVFYKYGDRIRKRSSLIASIQEEMRRNVLPQGTEGY